MASESSVQRLVWAAVASTSILFRVNTGRAYVSGLGPPGVKRLQGSNVLIEAARPMALGLALSDGSPAVGAADLCGWTRVVVTPDMVGKTLAVFTAIETKRTTGGRTSDYQRNFLQQVQRSGGIAGIANSQDSALEIIGSFQPGLVKIGA